ncbi:hypothetical protein CHARACLAT_013598 [Characodon lateralis]|uniref:Uncharacterized protein n=1 Tax=Characodon lateralis TaxID=208331 RepID=A0ABU7CXC6_9TELE|nr:hypothetical protein [Characodon lateralis]
MLLFLYFLVMLDQVILESQQRSLYFTPSGQSGLPSPSSVLLRCYPSQEKGAELLQADSCCKNSHSWRASGSPRLIHLTSRITKHLAAANTSLSSCLCPSSLFVSLSLSCLLVSCSPRLCGKARGKPGAERWDCLVSSPLPCRTSEE